MSYTVSRLLGLKQMEKAVVVAGEAGLNNKINGVTVLEDAELNIPMRKNSLVIANNCFLKAFADKGIDYVEACSRKGAAALFYKEHEKGFVITGEMLDKANALKLPIITVASDSDTVGLIDDLMRELLAEEDQDEPVQIDEGEAVLQLITGQGSAASEELLKLRSNEQICAVLIDFDPEVDVDSIGKVYNFCRSDWDKKCIALRKGRVIMIALCRSNTDAESDEVTALVQKLYEQIVGILGDAYAEAFRIAAGRSFADLGSYKESAFDASIAMSYMYFDRSVERVMHFENMGAFRIIFARRNESELRRLYRETLHKIYEYDKAHRSEFVITIKTLCKEGFSINAAAQALFVHYNTVVNRIVRIKELFGIDLMSENQKIGTYTCMLTDEAYKGWERRLELLRS